MMAKMKGEELKKKLKREIVSTCLNCRKFLKCEDIGKFEECADFDEAEDEAWTIKKRIRY